MGQRALAECVFTAAVSGSAPVRVIVPVVVAFGSVLLMCSFLGALELYVFMFSLLGGGSGISCFYVPWSVIY